jgi:hypothetical protein
MIPARLSQRSFFRSLFSIILFTLVLVAYLSAKNPAHAQTTTPGIKTDHGIYPKPAPPVLPAAGGKFIDPTFGTQIMRATDSHDAPSPGLSTYYSHWPTFNCNNTRLLIRKGETGDAIVKTFDPVNFTISSASIQLPGYRGSSMSWESSIWSNTDPDVIYTFPNYYDGGMKLYAYNVATNTFTLVKDFSSLGGSKDFLQQMYMSRDDDTFCWIQQRAGKDDPVYYLVYRRSVDKVLYHANNNLSINEVHVDKSGRYLQIAVNPQPSDNTRSRFLNLETGAIDFVRWNDADSPAGHGDLGTGTIVGFDSFFGGVNWRKLDDIHHPRLAFQFKDAKGQLDWTQDFHGSMLADNEDWITIGTYDDPAITLPDTGVFEDEIMQVALDGSGRVRRLAHTRCVIDNQTNTTGYWATPKPSISKDGRFIAFTSNWEKSGRYDLFIIKVDPAPRLSTHQPPPAPQPSTRPLQRPRRVNP